jgi:hypothetical protein
LLKAIYTDKAISPQIVADAYCAIAQKLGHHQPEISLPDSIAINELPNPVMILGSNPIAIALSRVPDLFNIEAFYHTNIPEDFQYHEDPVVITLADNRTETLQQLSHLRNNFWEGKFIAIAANDSSLQVLKQLGVFGDAEGRSRFNKMPGQIAIGQPILLCDLLLAPYGIEKMYCEDWENCKAKSGIGKLLKKVKMAEDLLTNDDRTGADQLVNEIVQKMAPISWTTILPHHDEHHPEDYLSMVKDLIASSNRATLHNNIDYIPKIRRILAFALGEAK